MYMGTDPGFLLHVQKCFDVCIPAIGHDADKDIGFQDLACIRVDDRGRVTCSVNLNLLAGFTTDMHGCTVLLLILLDVVAKLGIHERFFAICTAVLHVLSP